MMSRSDMIKEVGAGRALAIVGVSFFLYASTMLAMAFAPQPIEGVRAARTASPPAQVALASVDQTVFLPELYLPVGSEISVPIDQI
jgi:hypothetical protein